MKAYVGFSYSELDKHFEYYCDAENVWVWFTMGKMLPPNINLYPFFPRTFKGREYLFEANDATTLGLKCGKKLKQLFEKYGK